MPFRNSPAGAKRGIVDLTVVRPMHVAAYIEDRLLAASKPTVKQHLAAIWALFNWMVVGQAIEMNPAASVRGPKYSPPQRQDAGAFRGAGPRDVE
jgi:site-specific recombinase XerC